MIPADSFLLDGDTALVVVECPPDSAPAAWEQDDKPCDTCDGDGQYIEIDCPDCDGTGRHTFVVRWEAEPLNRWKRVHVIDVRRIVGWDPEGYGDELVVRERAGNHDTAWALSPENEGVTLPPDAAPGQWLVRLAVHTPENVDSPDDQANEIGGEMTDERMISDIREVDGVEYCVTHGGLLIEGANDDLHCEYEESESAEPCHGVALYYFSVDPPDER